jgi:large subunit ribosomal protein L15
VKLHELRPAPGSRKARTRVGRGIAAGKGKTAGRGTKGQKSRAGSGIPPWFEGGQTPIHVRVPKLRGFKNPFKIEYQVVNIGRIAEYAEAGRFGVEAESSGAKSAKGDSPLSVNPESLAAAGLVSSPDKPVKVLGQGDVTTRLLLVADAFTASARSKIEAAGGYVQLLNPPAEPDPERPAKVGKREQRKIAGRAAAEARAKGPAPAAAETEAPSKTEPKSKAKADAKAPAAKRPAPADAEAEAPSKTEPEAKAKAEAASKTEPESEAKADAKAPAAKPRASRKAAPADAATTEPAGEAEAAPEPTADKATGSSDTE